MRILSHFPAIGVSNTYLLGPDDGGPAILVDPGRFDTSLLELIEQNGFDVKTVLVTHDHANHIGGLRTLKKIYDARIIAGSASVLDFPARKVDENSVVDASGIRVDVLNVEGHSPDSRVYMAGLCLFTGDVLSAGRVGSSPTPQTRYMLIHSIQRKILVLDKDVIIFPGHGPPTTVGAERRWNPDLSDDSARKYSESSLK